MIWASAIKSRCPLDRQSEEGHVMDGCARLIYWWRLTIHFCHESITDQAPTDYRYIALYCKSFAARAVQGVHGEKVSYYEFC